MYSAGDPASFWPDTTFTEFGSESILSDRWSKATGNIFSASGLFHEHIHWTQLHSSNAGVFTFLLRHRRGEIIECFLRESSGDERRAYFEAWENGAPLWGFPQSYDVENPVGDPIRRRMMNHWNALLIFDQVFRLGNRVLSDQYNLTPLFEIANLHASGEVSIEEIFRSKDSRFDIDFEPPALDEAVFDWPKKLTWRSLEECAATLNQREFYANADVLLEGNGDEQNIKKELAALHEERLEEYDRDPSRQYLACLEYFFENNPELNVGDSSALFLLGVVVDIALNPPLPPFGDPAQKAEVAGFADGVSWHRRLHPVSRFIDLVQAVEKSDLYENPVALSKDTDAYRALVGKICGKAGLDDPDSDKFSNPIAGLAGGIWSALEDSPTRFLKSHVLQHHKRAAELKKTRPSAFAAPSTNLLYDPDFIPFLDAEGLQTLYLNPLQIVGGTGYFAGITDREYWSVLAAGSFNLALTSLLSPRAAFFDDGLPRDELHFAMVKKARDSLIARLRR